jgi:hypothetical protein
VNNGCHSLGECAKTTRGQVGLRNSLNTTTNKLVAVIWRFLVWTFDRYMTAL